MISVNLSIWGILLFWVLPVVLIAAILILIALKIFKLLLYF